MKLQIASGPGAGSSCSIPPLGLVIGRDDDCDWAFADLFMSRRHARIYLEDEVCWIEDQESSSGVWINDVKINGRSELHSGDRLLLGSRQFLVIDETQGTMVFEPTVARPAWMRVNLKSAVCLLAILVLALGFVVLGVVRRRAKRARRRPPAAARVAHARAYLWLESTPPGARVRIGGRSRGRTPLLVRGLAPRPQQLQLELAGYSAAERTLTPTLPGGRESLRLERLKGTCLVTSDPPLAWLFRGKQMLGATPLVLRDIGSGVHQLELRKPGFAPEPARVEIDPVAAGQTLVTLRPHTASVSITTTPAPAEVFLDNELVGVSPANLADASTAPALVISELLDDGREHELFCVYRGAYSGVQKVRLRDGETVDVALFIWMPDTIVTTKGGRSYLGLVRARSEAGDITLVIGEGREVVIAAARIARTRSIMPVRFRDNTGLQVRRDPDGGPMELVIDPFPEEP